MIKIQLNICHARKLQLCLVLDSRNEMINPKLEIVRVRIAVKRNLTDKNVLNDHEKHVFVNFLVNCFYYLTCKKRKCKVKFRTL